jgi:Ca-activated chloride channel family protein
MAAGPAKAAGAAAVLFILLSSSSSLATTPGLNAYQQGKFEDAYKEFQDTLKSHPQSRAEDKLQFDSGAAAYKLKDYNKALESFSQALLTKDATLQTKSHFNLGNTLYQRGETQKQDEKKLADWTNALDQYEQTLKLNPNSTEAKQNYEYVKKKIAELKKKQQSSSQQGGSEQSKPQQIEPSEAAKKAKAAADKAVMQRKFRTALKIMADQLRVDPTTAYYSDYIHRLEDINGIKRTDNS